MDKTRQQHKDKVLNWLFGIGVGLGFVMFVWGVVKLMSGGAITAVLSLSGLVFMKY